MLPTMTYTWHGLTPCLYTSLLCCREKGSVFVHPLLRIFNFSKFRVVSLAQGNVYICRYTFERHSPTFGFPYPSLFRSALRQHVANLRKTILISSCKQFTFCWSVRCDKIPFAVLYMPRNINYNFLFERKKVEAKIRLELTANSAPVQWFFSPGFDSLCRSVFRCAQ
jgi:hypothetical protein